MFDYIHHVAYVVSDMEEAISIFHDTFELELSNRKLIEGDTTFEMASFRCGPTLVEVLCPVNHPALELFLEENGPGLHHVAFAMRDLPKRIDELKEKKIFASEPFYAEQDGRSRILTWLRAVLTCSRVAIMATTSQRQTLHS